MRTDDDIGHRVSNYKRVPYNIAKILHDEVLNWLLEPQYKRFGW